MANAVKLPPIHAVWVAVGCDQMLGAALIVIAAVDEAV